MHIEFGQSFSLNLSQNLKESLKLPMLWVSPGKFTMGSSEDEPGFDPMEDELSFEGIVSKGFWLGQFPVTQDQWEVVMDSNPSFFKTDSRHHPIENVSWNDVLSFCESLNKRFLLDLPVGYRFTLPTEMQWEYSCRAGTHSPYYSGSSEDNLESVAWYSKNSKNQTHPVGEKRPNSWGFFDMHGNVFEWCYDTLIEYPKIPVTDWIGDGKKMIRSFRGGGWGETYLSGGLRSSSRGGGPPDTKRPWIGFRLCLRWIN